MIIKLIYILIFALADFMLYAKLNKTGTVKSKVINWFFAGFILFGLLHLLNLPFLMAGKYFLPLVFFLAFPVFSYFFYTFIASKRISKLKEKGVSEKFVDTGLKVFSFFFLRLTFIMVAIAQFMFIINPTQ